MFHTDRYQDVLYALHELNESGHPRYYDHEIHVNDETKEQLSSDLQSWFRTLTDLRRHSIYSCHFESKQLWPLHQLLSSPPPSTLHNTPIGHLLKFAKPNINLDVVRAMLPLYEASEDTNENVKRLAENLDAIFQDQGDVNPLRPLKVDNIHTAVDKGQVLVIAIRDPHRIEETIVSLYGNEGYVPHARQIQYCTGTQTEEQLDIFLDRCFGDQRLFVLADVQHLPFDLQSNLVRRIKQETARYGGFRLSLILHTTTQHHIMEQFSSSTRRLDVDLELRGPLSSVTEHVVLVSSTVCGLGKTEWVRNEAFKRNLGLITFPISGTVDPKIIMNRLIELKLHETVGHSGLHLVLSDVDDGVSLGHILFQLLVMGMMVVHGEGAYSLPDGLFVAIEV